MLVYLAFGSTSAWAAGEWDDWVDFVDTYVPDETQDDRNLDNLEIIKNALAATTVSGDTGQTLEFPTCCTEGYLKIKHL